MADSSFELQTNHDSTKIDMIAISNAYPMAGDPTKVASDWLALQGDQAVAALIGKIQTSTGIEYGAWAYPFTATTNSSGVATVYLTSDGTSTGTVAFSNKVFNPSASPIGIGAANYNVTAISVSGDRKTLTITLNQIKSVIGLLSYNATADAGVTVQGTIWGR